MKNAELIKQLQQFQPDMEVRIFDVKRNEADDSSEPSSEGVHKSIGVYVVHTDEQLAELKEQFPHVENFIALEFNSEN